MIPFSSTSTEIAVSLPAWLDLASVAVGGISGALVAKDRKLDLIGFIGLSMLCGLGGGLLRDVAMQVNSVYMIDNEYAIPSTIGIGLAVFFFARIFEKVPDLLEWVDIISVGLFALGGTDKAIVYHLLPVSAILMGTLTGVGGGMLRDVFLGDVPRIFKPSNYYAVCAVAGSAVYYALVAWVGIDKYISAVALMVVTVGLRRWSLRHDVATSGAHDLTPALKRAIRERARTGARRHGGK